MFLIFMMQGALPVVTLERRKQQEHCTIIKGKSKHRVRMRHGKLGHSCDPIAAQLVPQYRFWYRNAICADLIYVLGVFERDGRTIRYRIPDPELTSGECCDFFIKTNTAEL